MSWAAVGARRTQLSKSSCLSSLSQHLWIVTNSSPINSMWKNIGVQHCIKCQSVSNSVTAILVLLFCLSLSKDIAILSLPKSNGWKLPSFFSVLPSHLKWVTLMHGVFNRCQTHHFDGLRCLRPWCNLDGILHTAVSRNLRSLLRATKPANLCCCEARHFHFWIQTYSNDVTINTGMVRFHWLGSSGLAQNVSSTSPSGPRTAPALAAMALAIRASACHGCDKPKKGKIFTQDHEFWMEHTANKCLPQLLPPHHHPSFLLLPPHPPGYFAIEDLNSARATYPKLFEIKAVCWQLRRNHAFFSNRGNFGKFMSCAAMLQTLQAPQKFPFRSCHSVHKHSLMQKHRNLLWVPETQLRNKQAPTIWLFSSTIQSLSWKSTSIYVQTGSAFLICSCGRAHFMRCPEHVQTLQENWVLRFWGWSSATCAWQPTSPPTLWQESLHHSQPPKPQECLHRCQWSQSMLQRWMHD